MEALSTQEEISTKQLPENDSIYEIMSFLNKCLTRTCMRLNKDPKSNQKTLDKLCLDLKHVDDRLAAMFRASTNNEELGKHLLSNSYKCPFHFLLKHFIPSGMNLGDIVEKFLKTDFLLHMADLLGRKSFSLFCNSIRPNMTWTENDPFLLTCEHCTTSENGSHILHTAKRRYCNLYLAVVKPSLQRFLSVSLSIPDNLKSKNSSSLQDALKDMIVQHGHIKGKLHEDSNYQAQNGMKESLFSCLSEKINDILKVLWSKTGSPFLKKHPWGGEDFLEDEEMFKLHRYTTANFITDIHLHQNDFETMRQDDMVNRILSILRDNSPQWTKDKAVNVCLRDRVRSADSHLVTILPNVYELITLRGRLMSTFSFPDNKVSETPCSRKRRYPPPSPGTQTPKQARIVVSDEVTTETKSEIFNDMIKFLINEVDGVCSTNSLKEVNLDEMKKRGIKLYRLYTDATGCELMDWLVMNFADDVVPDETAEAVHKGFTIFTEMLNSSNWNEFVQVTKLLVKLFSEMKWTDAMKNQERTNALESLLSVEENDRREKASETYFCDEALLNLRSKYKDLITHCSQMTDEPEVMVELPLTEYKIFLKTAHDLNDEFVGLVQNSEKVVQELEDHLKKMKKTISQNVVSGKKELHDMKSEIRRIQTSYEKACKTVEQGRKEKERESAFTSWQETLQMLQQGNGDAESLRRTFVEDTILETDQRFKFFDLERKEISRSVNEYLKWAVVLFVKKTKISKPKPPIPDLSVLFVCDSDSEQSNWQKYNKVTDCLKQINDIPETNDKFAYLTESDSWMVDCLWSQKEKTTWQNLVSSAQTWKQKADEVQIEKQKMRDHLFRVTEELRRIQNSIANQQIHEDTISSFLGILDISKQGVFITSPQDQQILVNLKEMERVLEEEKSALDILKKHLKPENLFKKADMKTNFEEEFTVLQDCTTSISKTVTFCTSSVKMVKESITRVQKYIQNHNKKLSGDVSRFEKDIAGSLKDCKCVTPLQNLSSWSLVLELRAMNEFNSSGLVIDLIHFQNEYLLLGLNTVKEALAKALLSPKQDHRKKLLLSFIDHLNNVQIPFCNAYGSVVDLLPQLYSCLSEGIQCLSDENLIHHLQVLKLKISEMWDQFQQQNTSEMKKLLAERALPLVSNMTETIEKCRHVWQVKAEQGLQTGLITQYISIWEGEAEELRIQCASFINFGKDSMNELERRAKAMIDTKTTDVSNMLSQSALDVKKREEVYSQFQKISTKLINKVEETRQKLQCTIKKLLMKKENNIEDVIKFLTRKWEKLWQKVPKERSFELLTSFLLDDVKSTLEKISSYKSARDEENLSLEDDDENADMVCENPDDIAPDERKLEEWSSFKQWCFGREFIDRCYEKVLKNIVYPILDKFVSNSETRNVVESLRTEFADLVDLNKQSVKENEICLPGISKKRETKAVDRVPRMIKEIETKIRQPLEKVKNSLEELMTSAMKSLWTDHFSKTCITGTDKKQLWQQCTENHEELMQIVYSMLNDITCFHKTLECFTPQIESVIAIFKGQINNGDILECLNSWFTKYRKEVVEAEDEKLTAEKLQAMSTLSKGFKKELEKKKAEFQQIIDDEIVKDKESLLKWHVYPLNEVQNRQLDNITVLSKDTVKSLNNINDTGKIRTSELQSKVTNKFEETSSQIQKLKKTYRDRITSGTETCLKEMTKKRFEETMHLLMERAPDNLAKLWQENEDFHSKLLTLRKRYRSIIEKEMKSTEGEIWDIRVSIDNTCLEQYFGKKCFQGLEECMETWNKECLKSPASRRSIYDLAKAVSIICQQQSRAESFGEKLAITDTVDETAARFLGLINELYTITGQSMPETEPNSYSPSYFLRFTSWIKEKLPQYQESVKNLQDMVKKVYPNMPTKQNLMKLHSDARVPLMKRIDLIKTCRELTDLYLNKSLQWIPQRQDVILQAGNLNPNQVYNILLKDMVDIVKNMLDAKKNMRNYNFSVDTPGNGGNSEDMLYQNISLSKFDTAHESLLKYFQDICVRNAKIWLVHVFCKHRKDAVKDIWSNFVNIDEGIVDRVCNPDGWVPGQTVTMCLIEKFRTYLIDRCPIDDDTASVYITVDPLHLAALHYDCTLVSSYLQCHLTCWQLGNNGKFTRIDHKPKIVSFYSFMTPFNLHALFQDQPLISLKCQRRSGCDQSDTDAFDSFDNEHVKPMLTNRFSQRGTNHSEFNKLIAMFHQLWTTAVSVSKIHHQNELIRKGATTTMRESIQSSNVKAYELKAVNSEFKGAIKVLGISAPGVYQHAHDKISRGEGGTFLSKWLCSHLLLLMRTWAAFRGRCLINARFFRKHIGQEHYKFHPWGDEFSRKTHAILDIDDSDKFIKEDRRDKRNMGAKKLPLSQCHHPILQSWGILAEAIERTAGISLNEILSQTGVLVSSYTTTLDLREKGMAISSFLLHCMAKNYFVTRNQLAKLWLLYGGEEGMTLQQHVEDTYRLTWVDNSTTTATCEKVQNPPYQEFIEAVTDELSSVSLSQIETNICKDIRDQFLGEIKKDCDVHEWKRKKCSEKTTQKKTLSHFDYLFTAAVLGRDLAVAKKIHGVWKEDLNTTYKPDVRKLMESQPTSREASTPSKDLDEALGLAKMFLPRVGNSYMPIPNSFNKTLGSDSPDSNKAKAVCDDINAVPIILIEDSACWGYALTKATEESCTRVCMSKLTGFGNIEVDNEFIPLRLAHYMNTDEELKDVMTVDKILPELGDLPSEKLMNQLPLLNLNHDHIRETTVQATENETPSNSDTVNRGLHIDPVFHSSQASEFHGYQIPQQTNKTNTTNKHYPYMDAYFLTENVFEFSDEETDPTLLMSSGPVLGTNTFSLQTLQIPFTEYAQQVMRSDSQHISNIQSFDSITPLCNTTPSSSPPASISSIEEMSPTWSSREHSLSPSISASTHSEPTTDDKENDSNFDLQWDHDIAVQQTVTETVPPDIKSNNAGQELVELIDLAIRQLSIIPGSTHSEPTSDNEENLNSDEDDAIAVQQTTSSPVANTVPSEIQSNKAGQELIELIDLAIQQLSI